MAAFNNARRRPSERGRAQGDVARRQAQDARYPLREISGWNGKSCSARPNQISTGGGGGGAGGGGGDDGGTADGGAEIGGAGGGW